MACLWERFLDFWVEMRCEISCAVCLVDRAPGGDILCLFMNHDSAHKYSRLQSVPNPRIGTPQPYVVTQQWVTFGASLVLRLMPPCQPTNKYAHRGQLTHTTSPHSPAHWPHLSARSQTPTIATVMLPRNNPPCWGVLCACAVSVESSSGSGESSNSIYNIYNTSSSKS